MISRVKAFFQAQITQGVTPHAIALSCATAFTLAVFPLIGFTTLMCVAVGSYFRLNHAVMQAVNYAAAPAQLLLIPVFLRVGEWIFRAEPVSLNPLDLVNQFFAQPMEFLRVYGWSGFYAVVAWVLIAPLITALVFFSVRWLMFGLQTSIRSQ